MYSRVYDPLSCSTGVFLWSTPGHHYISVPASRKEKESTQEMCVLSIRFKPGSEICHFLSCPIGGNSVTWPHLAAREAGKCLTGQLCSWLPFFIYFFKIIFLIFWLSWVFAALHRLSLVGSEWGATLRCHAWASHYGGFSSCGAQTRSTWAW